MFGHFPELIIIVVIALIVFGPEKLPEMAATAGKMVREVRQTLDTAMHPEDHEVPEDFSAYYHESMSRSGEYVYDDDEDVDEDEDEDGDEDDDEDGEEYDAVDGANDDEFGYDIEDEGDVEDDGRVTALADEDSELYGIHPEWERNPIETPGTDREAELETEHPGGRTGDESKHPA
ncbi:MAG TPA: twin-arginine translocase TatA/TatE family subunit [Chloroflexota bacterium]|nr:twin-arginine translocase TatA/TatE family subunit [Chloroflexota bacterium]